VELAQGLARTIAASTCRFMVTTIPGSRAGPRAENYGSIAERLSKVRDEVVRVLEADGEPQQAFRRP